MRVILQVGEGPHCGGHDSGVRHEGADNRSHRCQYDTENRRLRRTTRKVNVGQRKRPAQMGRRLICHVPYEKGRTWLIRSCSALASRQGGFGA